MFDAERLLGGLLSQGLGSKRRRRRSMKWSVGLGAVGLAIAAWEHFSQSSGATAPAEPNAAPPTGAPSAIPPPPPHATAHSSAHSSASAGAAPADADRNEDAMLLIRAMICAANADGTIDAREQSRIIEKLVSAGLGSEERAFLAREFAAPPEPEALLSAVRDVLLAEQIYTVSRLTVDLDDTQEHAYLSSLAGWLGLSAARIAELELRALGQSS